jgi:hypothetical protein
MQPKLASPTVRSPAAFLSVFLWWVGFSTSPSAPSFTSGHRAGNERLFGGYRGAPLGFPPSSMPASSRRVLLHHDGPGRDVLARSTEKEPIKNEASSGR